MEKQVKKQINIWKKAVIKYRLSSSDCASELADVLRNLRDSGDQVLIKRVITRYSKLT